MDNIYGITHEKVTEKRRKLVRRKDILENATKLLWQCVINLYSLPSALHFFLS
jgi:hypothetical protein